MTMAILKPTNEKLKETILYILHKCKDQPTLGLKYLAKLLYFSDFSYYKLYNTSITGEDYIRIEHGPVPVNFRNALKSLELDGKIRMKIKKNDEYTQCSFDILAHEEVKLISKQEIKQLDKIIGKLCHLTGASLERLSHNDTPWQVTNQNKIIPYKLVFYRADEVIKQVE